MSSLRSAISVYKFAFCSVFLSFNNSKILHQKETLSLSGVLLSILQSFANFIIEHLRTAASETVAENSLRNLAWNGKFLIISHLEV